MSYAGEIPRVVGGVLRNPQLRRVQFAFLGFNAAEWGVWIAMLVYAYSRGGATTAGLVALAQLIPAMLFAPVRGVARRQPTADEGADRRLRGAGPRDGSDGGRAAGARTGARGVRLRGARGVAVTATRPAQAVLLPALARTAEELTAANVVAGWIESISVLAAPALAGLLLAVGGPGACSP